MRDIKKPKDEFIYTDLSGLQLYERILYCLAIFNFLTVSSLKTLYKYPKAIYREIARGIKEGHITVYNVTITYTEKSKAETDEIELASKKKKRKGKGKRAKYRGIQFRVKYKGYCITEQGLQYLKKIKTERLTERTRWVKEIPDAKKILRSGRVMVKSNNRFARYVRISAASQMAFMAGMTVAPLFAEYTMQEEQEPETNFFDDDINIEITEGEDEETEWNEGAADQEREGSYLGDIILTALNNLGGEQNENGVMLLNEESSVKYENVLDVKRKLKGEFSNQTDYIGSRISGIIQSPLKSANVYVGNKRGFNWGTVNLAKDIEALRIYCDHFGTYDNLRIGDYHGIMLVESSKSFEDLYFDTKKKNRKEKKKFGDGYQTMAVFPISNTGVHQLHEYMELNVKVFEEELARAYVENGACEYNQKGSKDVFPLVMSDGTKVTLCPYIDAVKCRKIESSIHPREKFAIICYEWQSDYYSRIFPNANYIYIMTVNE